MKKPLPVKVVEALGWVYVALAVMLWAMVMMSVFKNRIEWPEPLVIIFVCLCWMMLPVGMVLSLRTFVPTFIKSVLLWFFWSPFVPRRRVTMHIEDLTDRVKEWSHGTRLDFNRKLEEWYNA